MSHDALFQFFRFFHQRFGIHVFKFGNNFSQLFDYIHGRTGIRQFLIGGTQQSDDIHVPFFAFEQHNSRQTFDHAVFQFFHAESFHNFSCGRSASAGIHTVRFAESGYSFDTNDSFDSVVREHIQKFPGEHIALLYIWGDFGRNHHQIPAIRVGVFFAAESVDSDGRIRFTVQQYAVRTHVVGRHSPENGHAEFFDYETCYYGSDKTDGRKSHDGGGVFQVLVVVSYDSKPGHDARITANLLIYFTLEVVMTKISISTTDAGIPVITDPIANSKSSGYLVMVNTGSRDEKKNVLGISHLLEHVVFRSTKTRSSYQMAKEIEGAGGMMNAFTGKEYTGFYGLTINETSDVAKEMVSDILANPLIGDEDTEMEKKIVLQELSMIKNDPGSYIYDLIDETVWKGQELGQGEGGDEDIVANLNYRDLREYYTEKYGIPNFAVFAVGDVDEDETVSWASENFDDMKGKSKPSRKPPTIPKPEYRFVSNSSDHYQIALGFPICESADSEFSMPMSMLSATLGSGTSSRLFQEVREKNALVYSVYSSNLKSTDASYLGMFMSSTQENVEKSLNATSKVVRTFVNEGFEEGELERVKRMVKGEIIRSHESTARRMTAVAREYMLTGKLYTLEKKLSDIDATTEEDIMKIASKVLCSDYLNTVILGEESKELKEPIVIDI